MISVRTYALGLGILLGAICINLVADLLGLSNWYDFLSNPQLNVLTITWLFIGYPLGLGTIVVLCTRLLPPIVQKNKKKLRV